MKHSNTFFTKFIVLTLVASIALWSCKKEESTDPTTTLDQEVTNSSVETASEAQEEADKLESDINEIEKTFSSTINARTTGDTTVTFKRCASVSITKNTTASTRTVAIDYGTGCTDSITSGGTLVTITRKGKVTIVYTGKWNALNTVSTTAFAGYSSTITKNGQTLSRTISGTRKVTNLSSITFNSNGLTGTPKFRYENNLTIELPAIDNDRPAATVTYISDKTKTWSKGFGSFSPFDDEFTVTGTFSGTNRKGVAYSAEIQEAVTHKTECWKSSIFMPVSGKVKYTTARGDATVDYGDGTCDRKVTVVINGNTYEYDAGQ
ncbi:hypothetical protein [Microscilla marina]|uniref:hypothetical protein n=1 Tax=Microscilla marina TaxID=1027 RepID=UPI0012F80581|nr:hypothetical protein [Microscilla marina]